ncbi:trypsin-like serine protease [Ornithinimicrobium cerasi]|uniref:Trypsin n=1 Tax=Ornithinimicrobium cerasi TaxID=2248773 RepID=A0A285VW17_9MICO|nr:trypsin-like serine protease [Ornithinimicrobium cerasi]SOC57778.1 Trypsin [Ornithinimicrobium cerasi]
MRKNTLLAATAGLALVAGTAGPAAAIKYGQPDNGEHPYVGLMLAYVWDDLNEDEIQTDDELFAGWRCTGTQMDADTFLTAGHCTYGADAVAVWYDDNLQDVRFAQEFVVFEDAIDQTSALAADAWSYDAISHPDYDDSAFYLHDVGVVDDMILAKGTSFTQYGELPDLGYWDEQIDTRKKDRDSYTTVGYGLQWSMPLSNGQGRADQGDWLKLRAGGELIGYRTLGGGKTNDAYVVLTSNANTGGTCSGDSGGPTFIEETSTVVAVTSFGVNTTCAGTSGVYRIDTVDDLAWLGQFID